jgi:serine/threonine-protein kinase RsbW
MERLSCAIVEVTDSGPGFDIAGLTDPTDPGHLLTPGGRGVFLMRRLVDGVEYNRQGNRVRLTVRRHARGRGAGEPR